jgi:hypothetical protein
MPWEVAKGITTTTLLMDIADIGISQVTTTTLRDTGITIVILIPAMATTAAMDIATTMTTAIEG